MLAVLAALGTDADDDDDDGSEAGNGGIAANAEKTLDTSEQLLGRDHWYLQAKGDADATSLMSSESGDDDSTGGLNDKSRQELTYGRFSPAHMMGKEGDANDWITRSTAQVEVGSIDITLIDDYCKQDQPILLLSADVLVSAKNVLSTTQPLDLWANLSLALAFFNPRVSAWEPVLEPVVNSETHVPGPWQLQAHVRMRQGEEGRLTTTANDNDNSGGDSGESAHDAHGEVRVHRDALPDLLCVVSASERLELNFSNSFYSVLMSSVFVAGEDACSKDDEAVLEHQLVSQEVNPELSHTVMIKREFVEYLFVNATGHELSLTLHHPNRRNTTDFRTVSLVGFVCLVLFVWFCLFGFVCWFGLVLFVWFCLFVLAVLCACTVGLDSCWCL